MKKVLILGIGNMLMGNEGVGIHVVRYLQNKYDWKDVEIVDGGTGGFHLMEYFQNYQKIIMIDATIDDSPPGTIKKLQPKFSKDYPVTLTAHDIGLKDLLDSLYLTDVRPDILLYTISIPKPDSISLEISREIADAIPETSERIAADVNGIINKA